MEHTELSKCKRSKRTTEFKPGTALAGWLSRLKHQPVHWNIADSIPGQGTYLDCKSNAQSGRLRGSWLLFLYHDDISLSLSLSLLTHPLSLKINKHILGWGLNKKKTPETINGRNLKKKVKCLEIKPRIQITQRPKESQGKLETKRTRQHTEGPHRRCCWKECATLCVYSRRMLFRDGSVQAVSHWLLGDLSSLPHWPLQGCLCVLMTLLLASLKVGHPHCF